MPFDPFQPFTTAQALSAGISHHQLAGPEFRQLLHGVHISSRVRWRPDLRTRAALVIHPPSAVATHSSAARICGAPVPTDPQEHVTVANPDDRRQRRGVRCHVAALAAADVRTVQGLRISSPCRMFVELASALQLVDLVVVGDWLVRHRHTSRGSLVAYCREATGRHARAARRAASYVRERVDSPMETRLRMLLVLAGLPEPQVNLEYRDDHGNVTMRLDLSYPRVRLAVEYDGRHHAEVLAQHDRDHERRDDLEDDSWRLLVVTSRGIYKEPGRTVDRVWRALRARGWRPLPPPTDGWRPYFEH